MEYVIIGQGTLYCYHLLLPYYKSEHTKN